MLPAPNRLRLDTHALQDNWRALARLSGAAACGAAVKADGYGLGATGVVTRLAAAGCRDFFVATWREAAALADLVAAHDLRLSVLHGVRAADMGHAVSARARPVLNSAEQVARWRAAGGGACDVMVDTGMSRLGIAPEEVAGGLLDGLTIDTLLSHLVAAEEDTTLNARQRAGLATVRDRAGARRVSLANSAGIALGPDYAFDLTRPGLSLYGGIARRELADAIRPVATIEAEVLQCRTVRAGDTVGYNATWTAPADTRVATVNLGYADGYWRGFSDTGGARAGDRVLRVIGRVSMDLVAVAIDGADVAEGDWLSFDPDLPRAAAASGMSQYELLTGLGHRFDRMWG